MARDIVDTIEIEADPAFVLDAVTRDARRWWSRDAKVTETELTVRGARFAIDRKSLGGIALSCASGAWRGSRLHIALARMATGTRVAVLHTGLANAVYEQTLVQWRDTLASLKAYVETGRRLRAA